MIGAAQAERIPCCFIHEDAKQCEAEARFIIIGPSSDPLDYSYGCGDHAEDLSTEGSEIVRLSDGVTVKKGKR